MRAIAAAVPRVATMREAEVVQLRGDPDGGRLVGVGDGEEHGAAAAAARAPAAACALANAVGKSARDAHHLAGRAHLRAEQRVRRRGSGRTAAPPP